MLFVSCISASRRANSKLTNASIIAALLAFSIHANNANLHEKSSSTSRSSSHFSFSEKSSDVAALKQTHANSMNSSLDSGDAIPAHSSPDNHSNTAQLLKLVASISASFIVGLSGVVPVLFISYEKSQFFKTKAGQSSLKTWLSFAVGSIIGDTFLHILPEVWEKTSSLSSSPSQHARAHTWIGVFVIVGFLTFFFLEKIVQDLDLNESENESVCAADALSEVNAASSSSSFSSSSTEVASHLPAKMRSLSSSSSTASATTSASPSSELPPNSQSDQQQQQTSGHSSSSDNSDRGSIQMAGYLNLLANFVDNFTHGLAVGASFLISFKVGLLTTLCIIVHEVPHEISDFVILLRAGFDRWRAARLQFLTATGCSIGAMFAFFVDNATIGISEKFILPFTSGGFLYISLVTLCPVVIQEENAKASLKQVFLILLGIGMMLVMSLVVH